MSTYEPFVKDDVEKKKSVFCLVFIFFSGHFFFCCELVSVIDHVASVTRLSFGCPTPLGLCLSVQRVNI